MLTNYIELLKTHGELSVIETPLDIDLEIAHLAYLEVKKYGGGKALLFTNPISKRLNKTFDMPVLMNVFGSKKRLDLIFGQDTDAIAAKIAALLKPQAMNTWSEKFASLTKLLSLKTVFPKRKKALKYDFEQTGAAVNLFDLPILKTWQDDGGPFITMACVYTQSLDGKMQNLGLYRIQVQDNNHISLHWQIHKDSSHFFDTYCEAKQAMPVTITIGGDPLYTWCASAPLPHGIFELMLYGFVKKSPAVTAACKTNDLFVARDVDIVIEALVQDPSQLAIEGPFGDHTGYYTPKEPFPLAKVTAIKYNKNSTYLATVVGKPPLEDKYMGEATARIFLPLLKTTAPALIDYKMPENGVFHNLILAKIQCSYPGHAKQLMHNFWGNGQMSFVKHAIFVDEKAPELKDENYKSLANYILDRFSLETMLLSTGIIDHLDHSSKQQFIGGKLGIDATNEIVEDHKLSILSDIDLLLVIQKVFPQALQVKQYLHSKNPVTLILYDKKTQAASIFEQLKTLSLHIKIVILIDNSRNDDINDMYMNIWRICNNIDILRDFYHSQELMLLDASNKNKLDNYDRHWPKDVLCKPEVVKKLVKQKLINLDDLHYSY